jgi:hypothetical protein
MVLTKGSTIDSYTWDGLLKEITQFLFQNNEKYYDIKHNNISDVIYKYDKIALELEEYFNTILQENRNGRFKEINDKFYKKMSSGVDITRMKIYISSLLKSYSIRDNVDDEIKVLKNARKNVGSVITTNYDTFIEDIFEFNPLIGNDILLSNPYGSVYKIHGCVNSPDKIIITNKDYEIFDKKYELIRAQLLSLFIHNPIIFLGYSMEDENIKNILKTIFTYIDHTSSQADKIKRNFLLVEYEERSNNEEVVEHDIVIEGSHTIKINKIKTDAFKSIYNEISKLNLQVSAMDVRKVQSVVKEIYSGGKIKVSITEDIDSLNNDDKIIAIGSAKTITYIYQNSAEIISKYFKIIDESNFQIISLIDKFSIQENQYFPIYKFSRINENISKTDVLKKQQDNKIKKLIENIPESCKSDFKYNSIEEILRDSSLTESRRVSFILCGILLNFLNLDEIESYLRNFEDKKSTNYRKLLCAYDSRKYN